MKYRAGIREEFARDAARLMVARDWGTGREELLMQDGSWQVVAPGSYVENAGCLLPLDALEAVVTAIRKYKGDALDSATESKVLRAWRQAESDRVTDLTFTLTALLEQVISPITQPPSSEPGMDQ